MMKKEDEKEDKEYLFEELILNDSKFKTEKKKSHNFHIQKANQLKNVLK